MQCIISLNLVQRSQLIKCKYNLNNCLKTSHVFDMIVSSLTDNKVENNYDLFYTINSARAAYHFIYEMSGPLWPIA